jgi:N-methylhydantoinase B
MAAHLPLAGRIEILRQRLVAIAERMGQVMTRTAASANIKERRDHSCAIFDPEGRLLAQAAHIPVHLGSMADSVAAVTARLSLAPGDVAILNDPFAGGTHLPDITMVAPIYATVPVIAAASESDAAAPRHSPGANATEGAGRAEGTGMTEAARMTEENLRLIGYAAARAHHADVGGAHVGSMGVSRSIHEEGLRIPPVLWMHRGRVVPGMRDLLLANVRTPDERLADLAAQSAACDIGAADYAALVARYDTTDYDRLRDELHDYAERRMRAVITAIPDGDYVARDVLEGDGVTTDEIPIAVTLRIRGGAAEADFSGTAPAAAGCVNCPLPVTRAAVSYAFVCLAGRDLPHNAGMSRPITLIAPTGCLVNASFPSAVAAGNVETSQRIVDVVLAALARAIPARIPASSAGTMCSVAIGGVRPDTGQSFAYYETIGGGAGASAQGDGASGIQTHMTNTRNTPVEAMESDFPVRVRAYRLRAGSGGNGAKRGGDGIEREITALVRMNGAILADRFVHGPAGRNGGASGATGQAAIESPDGATVAIASKSAFTLNPGDTLRIHTPGGGGRGGAANALTGP